MKSSVKERLITGTRWNFIGYLWLFLLGLAIARYIVHNLGLKVFGMWVLLESTVGYFGLLDLGLRTSFVKYIATFWGQRDTRRINHFTNTGAIAYFVFACAIAILGITIFPRLYGFLQIPRGLEADAYFVFLVVLAVFALENLTRPFTAVLGGLMRYDVENKIKIAGYLIYAALVFVMIGAGYGIRGVVLASALRFLFITVLCLRCAFRLLPGLRFNPLLFRASMLKTMLRFGIKLQIIKLEVLITYNTDYLILSHFIGLGAVAFYNLGYRVASQIHTFCLNLDSLMVPATSELDARSEQEKIEALYFRGTKYLCFLAMGALGFVMVAAPLVMRAWMGEGYGLSVLAMRLLALSFFVTVAAKVGRSIAIGIDRMGFYLKLSVLHGALNLLISIWLTIKIGFPGVLLGTLIAHGLTSIWFVVLFHRMLELPLRSYARRIWSKTALASALPALPLIGLNSLLLSRHPIGAFSSLSLIAAEGVVFLAAYTMIVRLWNFFDSYDRALIKEKIPLLAGVIFFRADKASSAS